MAETLTVDEAREHLRETEVRYREIEDAHRRTLEGVSTADRVLAQVETRAALEDAARELLAARETYIVVDTEWQEQRRREAEAELSRVEADLVVAIDEAERVMAELVPVLKHVADLSKQRYGYRKTAGRTATQATLARAPIAGWLQWRLQPLELVDLGVPPHHYRAPLKPLLGLQGIETETNNTNQQGEQS